MTRVVPHVRVRLRIMGFQVLFKPGTLFAYFLWDWFHGFSSSKSRFIHIRVLTMRGGAPVHHSPSVPLPCTSILFPFLLICCVRFMKGDGAPAAARSPSFRVS